MNIGQMNEDMVMTNYSDYVNPKKNQGWIKLKKIN